MVAAGRWASLALLAFAVADAIRTLRDGPMVDAEGREYKSIALRTDTENVIRPKLSGRTTVRVQCTGESMMIVVKTDLSPGKLYIGDAAHSDSKACRAVAAGDGEYIINAGLQDCGFQFTMSEDFVTFSNKLIFLPAVSFLGITRMTRVFPVSCHYKRMSTNPQPSLTFTPTPCPAGSPVFSLNLLTDDWRSETSSRNFYLGDPLLLEASYTGPERRRLFIDSCVATLTPDATSVPRHQFVQNHGCLTYAKLRGSNALFRPRTTADSLQLQLNAFLFQQDSRNSIFLTCQVSATPEMWTSSPVNKACNYAHPRWENVDGSDGVCQCCDAICHAVVPRDAVLCATVTLGPVMIFHRK